MTAAIEKLRAQLDSSELKENVGELLALFDFLEECIIGKNYRIPDDLTKPIELSDLGKSIYTEVMARRRLKPNEVKLAIAFEVGCPAGLLINLESDAISLRQSISVEIRSRRILFPYIFGRDLHDLAALKYPEKTHLDNLQTISLLKELPIGVFQHGRTIVGPFGATESAEVRKIGPRKSVPGYLCSDETCNRVHSIDLRTADSSIIKARRFVVDYIHEHHGGTDDEYARLLSDAVNEQMNSKIAAEIGPGASLFDTLADSFTEEELRLVTETALRVFLRASDARSILSKRLGAIVANPVDFVATLDRPSLLQLLLTFENREVTHAVDTVIRSGRLPIEEYEVRESRLDRNYAGFDSAEVGPLGVRSYEPSIVSARLYALLHRLYYEAGILEPADLEYGLGSPPDSDPTDLLGLAVRKFTPRELLQELILGNRRAAWDAAEYVGVVDPESLTRQELLESLLWKLGAPNDVVFTELDRMKTHESDLLSANESGDEESVRGHISNLFAAVEDALQRSLTFAIWALSEDHFLNDVGFRYDPMPDAKSLEWLNKHAPASNDALTLKNDGKNTLVPLAAGFGRLAKGLKSLHVSAALRPRDHEPLVCHLSSRPFAFRSFITFLNLTTNSQNEISNALQEVSALFADSIVAKVRNSTMHGNNPFPSPSEIRLAVDRVRNGRLLLGTSGLFPQVYALESDDQDVFGRSRVRYLRGDRSIDIFRPVWPVAPRMPAKMSRLVIFGSASFGAVGPLRFSLKTRSGAESYWEGWPKRWRVERRYSKSELGNLDDSTFGESVSDESA